jgi:hypothetical protein
MTAAVADVLDKAADLLERNGGWCRGFYYDGASRSVTGALMDARGEGSAEEQWLRYGWAMGCLARFIESEEIDGWNDAPGRTASEVISTLRAAAAQERKS